MGTTLEIQGKYFEVKRITGNCVPYHRVSSDKDLHVYEAEDERPSHSSVPLVCLQAEDGIFLPDNITVNGDEFHKWLGPTFVPVDISPETTEQYFDMLAPEYHKVAALKLNAKVYSHFFRTIEKRMSEGNVKLFDFGIGTGEALGNVLKWRTRRQNALMPRLELAGGDMSEGMLREAPKHFPQSFAGIMLYKCEYSHVPVAKASFDVVTACFVTHYFVDKRPFEEIRRILRPGGLFIFNAYQSAIPGHEPEPEEYHGLLKACGFQFIHIPHSPLHISYIDEQEKPEQRSVTIISAIASDK